MKHCGVIVIGAAAGGIEAVREIASKLPRDLPTAVCLIVHEARDLPSILNAAGPLPACYPRQGALLEPGHLYAAPYDQHLLIESGRLILSHGPKENLRRPAINPLFRTAARAYGSAAVGVILTGALDDGTSGLWELKQSGGVAVVQDPKEAAYPSMPRSALEFVDADYTVPLSEIADLLVRLATGEWHSSPAPSGDPMETIQTNLTCPECRGPVHEEHRGKLVEYCCRVGHIYSLRAMAYAHIEAEERTLWAAMVVMEEAADIAKSLTAQFGEPYAQEAQQKFRNAQMLRDMVQQLRYPENSPNQ